MSCYSSLRKANRKKMKDCEKNKEYLYLNYYDANNLHEWAMSQKLSLDSFKWVEEIFQFSTDFM